jgi:uncharacterized cofD-like protein
MLNVVLFCGGSGSSSLVKELSRQSDCINTTLIINPFDDGKSTGRLRQSIHGLPGISDFRKNIVSSSPLESAESLNVRVDDFAVGNGLIASLFLAIGSFQAAVDEAARFFRVPLKILSITDDPATLSAILDSGDILESEAEIVGYGGESRISSLAISGLKKINANCISAINQADLIIFGAGTQHSSLLPTYMALSKYGKVDISKINGKKLLVVNLKYEGDTQNWSVIDFVNSVDRYWGVELGGSVDGVLCDRASAFPAETANTFKVSTSKEDGYHDGKLLLDAILKWYNSFSV